MEPFKNNFSEALVYCIAHHLKKHLNPFNRSRFLKAILPELNQLELKARSQHIADALHHVLPTELKLRYRILLAMLHPDEDATQIQQSDENGIRGWGILPLSAVVGQHGLSDFEASLAVLKEMTKRFSAEFDVRYFLLHDLDCALNIMSRWVSDPNRHVRRLVSEGSRPRLPWAMQLPQIIADPSLTLPLLKALRNDEEEYVRRSVANHLNDISKDHPDLIAQLAIDWKQDDNTTQDKLLRHACRTLIKQGHPLALKAFGYSAPHITLESITVKTPYLKLGNALEFSVCIKSQSKHKQPLIIDYVIHHKKSTGKLTQKVFKWKKITLPPLEKSLLERSHTFRLITTRQYYSGTHALSVRINGHDFGYVEFHLSC